MIELQCTSCSLKTRWNSSPYLIQSSTESPKFLVNWRIGHSFLSSGLREAQYENLFAAANMGHLSSEFLAGMRKKYKTVVEELCTKSKTDALRQEIASTEDLMQGIEIMTDARHGTRKNAKDTDVICLGGLSHKCLWNGLITRAVDPVTQPVLIGLLQQVMIILVHIQTTFVERN